MNAEEQRQEILEHIATDELAALTRDLVDIPSPTGHEREIGELILDWYQRHGTKTVSQQTDAERITHAAEIEGEAIKQKSELEAEKKARERRDARDKETTEALADLNRDQKRLATREDSLDKKFAETAARQ